jgi:hypothetical protein
MSRIYLFKRASALVIALVASISLSAHAAKPAGAQLGVVSIGGSLTSGSDLSYKFNLNVTTNTGTLVVKAKITGKKFKANFPVLTITNPAVGTSNDVSGTSVHIPTNFTGKAVVRVTATFNRKKIGAQTLPVTITASLPSTALTVTTNLYDVGFENSVTLDGAIVPISGMTGPLTYTWTQTSGKTVTLSTNGLPQTSFTTDAVTNFVNMGTALYVNDIDDSGNTNLLYVTPEHRFGTLGGLALDNEQATAATYGFQLLVSDGSATRTGIFTVACSIQTPAQPNIPVGVAAFYRSATNSTSWSLLSKPAGSTATLLNTNALVAELRPDIEGLYVIQDNVTGKVLTNTAASWTGVQFCSICHGPNSNVGQADLVTPWGKTLHATMAQRGVDGVLGSHYSEACFQCHTVGFNQSPAATNGNFYAIQQQLGWAFPTVLQAGNYAAMPDELKNLANIQCENCHGPGSRHPGSPSISLDVKVCASCHQDGTHHVRPSQWEISPHAGAYENISNSRGTSPACARCHSPLGFMDVAKGNVSPGVTNVNTGNTAVPTGTGPLTCQICHDPHDTHGDNPDRHQLRVFDTVKLGYPLFPSSPTVTVGLGDSLTTADLRLTNSTVTVTNVGASAACIVCHNARQWPTQVQITTNAVGKMFYQSGGPHDQTAGEAFLGIGAYDYGQAMGNSFHTHLADCQACHMYLLRAPSGSVAQDEITIDDVVTPVTTTVYNQFVNVLGDHTFMMDYVYSDTNGVQHTADNIAACNQCHASFEPVDSFDFKTVFAQDYDGNGVIEGVQTETKGVLSNLAALIVATGVSPSTNATGQIFVEGFGTINSFSSTAGYSTNTVLKEAQRKAVWNWLLEYREGSFGVHNTQWTVRLLQTSYTDLSTNFHSDVTRTYENAFTNAFLR